MPYAEGTAVTVARSIAEMERLVTKHGATGFGYGSDAHRFRVMFRIADRAVRMDVARPSLDEFRTTARGYARARGEAEKFRDQEERRRLRALTSVVKALLVAVAEGIISLSDAFLPYTVLPQTNETFGQWAGPQLDTIAATGQLPSPLPGSVLAIGGRTDA